MRQCDPWIPEAGWISTRMIFSGRLCGDFLDVHAAGRRGHERDAARVAVEQQAEVQLALDLRAGLDVDLVDRQAVARGLLGLEPLPEHALGRRGDVRGRLDHLDAARLAAATGVHLRLDHPDRTSEPLGGVDGLFWRGGDETRRHRDAVAGEQLLGLVFVEVHGLGRAMDEARQFNKIPGPSSRLRERVAAGRVRALLQSTPMAPALKPGLLDGVRPAPNVELPWRVLSLLNVFRLLLPMLLLLVFFFNAPTQQRGRGPARPVHRHRRRLLRLCAGVHPDPPGPHASGRMAGADPAVRRCRRHRYADPRQRRRLQRSRDAAGAADRRDGGHPDSPLRTARHVDGDPGPADRDHDFVPAGRGFQGGFPDHRPDRCQPVRDHAAGDSLRGTAARERGPGQAARDRPRQPERTERIHRAAPAREHPGGGRHRPGATDQRDGGAVAQGWAGAGRRHARGGVAAAGLPAAGLAQPDPRPPRQRGRSGRRRRRHRDPAAFRGTVGKRRRPGADLPGGHQRHR